ncbi:MAG TPA: hypothetical protein VEG65_02255 [Candidatus Bathyarchaeia archaeon]|nr:hypothetical protein [Candidatus Bathyarchaeia archaeon]
MKKQANDCAFAQIKDVSRLFYMVAAIAITTDLALELVARLLPMLVVLS